MTPRDRYRAGIKRWTAFRDARSARADALSRLRLVSFFAAAIALVWGLHRHSAPMSAAGAAALAAFAYLVVRHARVLEDVDRANAAIALGAEGLARLARDWNALPDIPPPSDLSFDTHPYARDLDLYGHASLTKWLGRPATADGTSRLARWLLAPAAAGDIGARHLAIDELAAKTEWRESFAIQGRLVGAAAADMTRFLAWAEDTARAVPAALNPVAVVLPAMTWILLAMWLAGAIQRLPPLSADTLGLWFYDGMTNGWWWLPVTVSVTLSWTLAKRIHAAFDRVTLGERALGRYAVMLSSACDEAWRAPRLAALQADLRAGGSAPDRVRGLARLAGWSELRSSAAIFHLMIQALTLSDFHVLFALERWRSQAGRHVRAWLEALGEIDALATLSRVRADHPGWATPVVGSSLRQLDAQALGHPLIAGDRRVTNDVRIGPAGTLLFVTGSNMSGKSTLLRAIGVNIVLAQAGAPVCAHAFRTPAAQLYTSIRVEDSLERGVSYFMAALARLKLIVDAAERARNPGPLEPPVLLYLLDEVLQGTNSIERGLAVRAVARHLLDAGAIGAMTSHDLALAGEEPLTSAAVLVHFSEQVHDDGTMTFDYRLRPGLATSRNAIRLMQLIGITPR